MFSARLRVRTDSCSSSLPALSPESTSVETTAAVCLYSVSYLWLLHTSTEDSSTSNDVLQPSLCLVQPGQPAGHHCDRWCLFQTTCGLSFGEHRQNGGSEPVSPGCGPRGPRGPRGHAPPSGWSGELEPVSQPQRQPELDHVLMEVLLRSSDQS